MRIFDNLKQISSFMYLFKNNKIKDFDKIEYFFADDVDEYSYCAFEFCKTMIKKTKDLELILVNLMVNGQNQMILNHLFGPIFVCQILKSQWHILHG